MKIFLRGVRLTADPTQRAAPATRIVMIGPNPMIPIRYAHIRPSTQDARRFATTTGPARSTTAPARFPVSQMITAAQ